MPYPLTEYIIRIHNSIALLIYVLINTLLPNLFFTALLSNIVSMSRTAAAYFDVNNGNISHDLKSGYTRQTLAFYSFTFIFS